MKKFIIPTLLLLITSITTVAWADLDGFLSSLNVQAQADLPGFKLRIASQFGVPVPQVESVFAQVRLPADTFMTFQLSQMSRQQPERVIQTYNAQKGKGWGVIAKELGIKPGSAEFHALKRGDLHFTGQPAGSGDAGSGPGQRKGKSHGKGHNK